MTTIDTPIQQDPHIVTELPGPRARAVIEQDERYSSPSLTRVYPLVVARGEGAVIEDVDGNRFLDFNAGIAVNAAGHNHPKVNAAIHAQVDACLHYCSSDFFHPSHADLVERLATSVPAGMGDARVFLANSGTEAVEGALKLARHHTGRPNVIAFYGAFHGRSLGSLSLTSSKAKYRSGFGIVTPGSYHAPFAYAAELTGADYIEQVLFHHMTEPGDVAAIFVEPIQGEGGYIVPPAGWLQALRDLCDRHGILLVMDEVQSGIGRTGTMWACQHDDVTPDIITAGKGLASGMPLSAIIARDTIMQWAPGKHGSTFGGNPVACAAALATMDLVDDELAANAAARGEQLMAGLRALQERFPIIQEVRGRGLMIGFDLVDHDMAVAFEQACFERGVLSLTCGKRGVRLAPPLVITEAQCDRALEIIADACEAVTR
ncbi:4-aminobutyrate aminotransferase [Ilumatobacter fluminis]|uniref:(S)-3-amino-2-methylpropionate transaminase n=1 Tax=Ilumatobacter fluminis TaxID=467091 RepID=A0A4R7I4T7_9ACTN|nr:aminotransferase class III-fold pyridoxal phosphate-dependent enzyme [Ilumatobacter fluminis]TDT18702.1 4-aminobutyrate aminotransferase [Ilumatobacter fluminis]